MDIGKLQFKLADHRYFELNHSVTKNATPVCYAAKCNN